MLESEKIIEREATIRRGRRCSLSLKDGPGRETCRTCSTTPSGTRPSAPRAVIGRTEDTTTTLASHLSARDSQQGSLHSVASAEIGAETVAPKQKEVSKYVV